MNLSIVISGVSSHSRKRFDMLDLRRVFGCKVVKKTMSTTRYKDTIRQTTIGASKI